MARRGEPALTLSWPDRLIEAGALFLLIFTPLAYGTVQPWSEAIAELVVLAMLVTYIIGTLRSWELRVQLPPGWLPAALFLALAVFQALAPHSLDPHTTRREALKLLAVAAFFLVCYNSYRTRAQVRRAIWTMIAMGTVISVFGVVQRMTWNGHLYWVGPTAPVSAFGPFVNRAHFAGLMVVIVPMALALALADSRRARRRHPRWSWGDRLRDWNSSEGSPSRLIWVLVPFMGGAVLVSGSRGGVVALLAVLIAMIAGSLAQRRGWRGHALRLAVVSVLVILAGAWIGSDILYGTAERLAGEVARPEDSGRLRLWRDAITLWWDAPLLGTGLGTFAVAYPPVRTIEAPVFFSHAESDWVELLTDTGVIGLGLAVAVAACVLLHLLLLVRCVRDDLSRTLTTTLLIAFGASLLQSLANYNLSIMANLLCTAAALSALAANAGRASSGQGL